jgi:hypothetical protein
MTERKRIGEKRGPRKTFNCDDFFNAVKVVRSMSPTLIAEEMRKSLSTIKRYIANKKGDPDIEACLKKCRAFLGGIDDAEFTSDLANLDIFSKVPIIRRWDGLMLAGDVSADKRRDWIGGLMHLCKYLDVHPDNLTLRDASRVNVEVRELYRQGKKAPYGLGYARLRESIRGFFMRVHEVAPVTLNNAGVTKEALRGQGRYANQKVSEAVRHKFVDILKEEVGDVKEYLDALGVCKAMFYSGGRISAMLEFSFRKNQYELSSDVWMIEIIDKGEHGGTPWRKYFVGHALTELKEIFSQRFKIPIEDLEKELPRKTEYLFPSYIRGDGIAHDSKLRGFVKPALIRAGLPYVAVDKELGKRYMIDGVLSEPLIGLFPPLHIWRHTFAQEFLSASNWNYELCASLGGWATTHRLKKHYGKMGRDPMLDGLKTAMGITVPKEVKELRW